MIDVHCHVLPGIDDGPRSLEESLLLCRAARADGTRTIVATPHVDWTYTDVDAAEIDRLVGAVNQAISTAAIDLHIVRGAEVALSRASELSDDELRALCLAGGHYVLVELPWMSAGAGVVQALRAFSQRGFGILLAHPERTPMLQEDLQLVRALVEQGVLCCVTATSLNGGNGRRARAAALSLIDQGLAHAMASDAHNTGSRPPELRSELVRAGLDEDQIDYYARAAPEAILGGGALPAPPTVKRSRRLRWARRARG